MQLNSRYTTNISYRDQINFIPIAYYCLLATPNNQFDPRTQTEV